MKTLGVILFASLGIVDAGSQQPTAARLADDLRAIEELHQRDIAATKAFDVETLVSLWTDDIVSLAPGQSISRGKALGRKTLESGRAQMRNIEVIDYQQHWDEVRVSGDTAYEWGTFLSVFRTKEAGEIRQKHNVLRVLQRGADGKWKVHRTIWNNAPNN